MNARRPRKRKGGGSPASHGADALEKLEAKVDELLEWGRSEKAEKEAAKQKAKEAEEAAKAAEAKAKADAEAAKAKAGAA